jgi:hypothetical protein
LLTGAIVASVGALVDRKTELLLVVAICCFCFGADTLAAGVGFVVVVVEDTADVGGVAVDNEGGFSVFGMPHIFDSVVLTTLRLGLLGSHIFALSSADIVVVLSEPLLPAADDDADDNNCCAYT